MATKRTTERLIAALAIAYEEIHHPGSARSSGVDIDALISGVLKEAAPGADIAAWVREELSKCKSQAA